MYKCFEWYNGYKTKYVFMLKVKARVNHSIFWMHKKMCLNMLMYLLNLLFQQSCRSLTG